MAWTIPELQHNASILYNHLCSDDADKVYVDTNGHLQVSNRFWLFRWLFPLGDSSRTATDKVAIRTLRRVLNALENHELSPVKIFIQEYNHLIDPNPPLESMKWLSKDKFAINIGNAARFKSWMPIGNRKKHQLSYEQKVCSRVSVLTGMIEFGKKNYIETWGDFGYDQFGYDQSDDEI